MSDHISQVAQAAASQLVEPFEGFKPAPYRDSGGVWTYGYGSTRDLADNPVTASTPSISRAQALQLVARDIRSAVVGVEAAVHMPLTFDEEVALADLAYNIGQGNFNASALLRLLNEGDYTGAAAEFLKWDQCKGVVLVGLLRRRQAEQTIFETH